MYRYDEFIFLQYSKNVDKSKKKYSRNPLLLLLLLLPSGWSALTLTDTTRRVPHSQAGYSETERILSESEVDRLDHLPPLTGAPGS